MKIIFYSGTGNTEKMAELIGQGIELTGKKAELIKIQSASVNDIKDEEVIVFGCPAYGDENLEESYVEPFMDEIDGLITGKKVALFGSYGWGDGEWMRNWEERIKSMGAELVKEGLTVNEAPDDEDECINFGKEIAAI